MTLTSSNLQSMYGQGAGSEVMCNIGSAVHDLTHPFAYTGTNGEMFEYAERSTVYVFGRIGMMMRDNTEIPKLTVFGGYADAQAKLDQLSAMNRRQQLMLTLLETFANEVLTSTRKLQENVAQTNATLQEAESKIADEEEI